MVFITDDSVTVTVKTQGLQPADTAKITDIVVSETKFPADKIKIVEVKQDFLEQEQLALFLFFYLNIMFKIGHYILMVFLLYLSFRVRDPAGKELHLKDPLQVFSAFGRSKAETCDRSNAAEYNTIQEGVR